MHVALTEGYRASISIGEIMGKIGEMGVVSMTDIAKISAPTMQRVEIYILAQLLWRTNWSSRFYDHWGYLDIRSFMTIFL